ncbi:site-specific DNA recombinase [Desulfuromonas soudanensis]|uniref:Site-specific DNA recombinase n=1 Tax=Desulfuromonas soudanensis TaxID=1603606 RepID=A0A0M4D5E9_9BACT|nr:site-specific DNA recombinase [Desulfuromonas soudanensis]
MVDLRGRTIGYKRVSSFEQNTARQLEGMRLDVVFEEKVSGKDTKRPELMALLKTAYKGDTVVVHSMDRLARNLIDLKMIVSELVEKGTEVKFVKENLTFSGKADHYSQLMLNLMGSFAEFERSLIKSRQMEGIAIRKAAGLYKGVGRKRSITDDQIAEINRRVSAGEMKTKIAKDMKISRESIYKLLKK